LVALFLLSSGAPRLGHYYSGDVSVRILPAGETALLVEFGSLDEVLGWYRAADAARPGGLVDLVPGARTVLAVSEPRTLPLEGLRSWIDGVEATNAAPDEPVATVTIDVRYDGEDLDEVARILGISIADLISLHTSSIWTVAFGGFAPGFGYLATDHSRLVVRRRETPRTVVPAGAVGLAGEFSGIYPRSSPGGWQLLGITDAVMWDVSRNPPALLIPGTIVRFRAVS
jgi:KipI family sensor histidine kinase inhibitor